MYTISDPAPLALFQTYSNTLIEQARLDASPPTIITGPPPNDTQGHAPQVRKLPTTPITRVAIIGAGCAGLHAASILASNSSVGADIDILEASDRVGGRLYTHRFDNGNEWDYFDVGAMRFPKTPVMDRTFKLFDKLEIPRGDYHIIEDQNFMMYNEIRKLRSELKDPEAWKADPFNVCRQDTPTGTIPGLDPEFAKRPPGELLFEAIKPWIAKLLDVYKESDEEKRMKKLQEIIQQIDKYSTRSFLSMATNEEGIPVPVDDPKAVRKAYPADIINWIETMSFGTGWFDRALIETCMEEIAFQFDKPSPDKLEWVCVQGGSALITEKMAKLLENEDRVRIKTKHRVTSIELHPANPNSTEEIEQHPHFTISILHPNVYSTDSLPLAEKYSHVIFATPPPCIRMIDISTCQLDFLQRKALREVQLAPSCKIGMRFTDPWWKEVGITKGGQSTTDRTARTIVYPSQGEFESNTLIVSYCWTQDSLALGAMMQDEQSKKRLQQLMLADLAAVHEYPLEKLQSKLRDWYPFDWSHNPHSIGAFGLFGPDQFRCVYPHLIRPAAGTQMHFIGETLSPIHGWVAGALESAERAVLQMLLPFKAAQKPAKPSDTVGKDAPSGAPGVGVYNGIKQFKKEWEPTILTSEKSLVQLLALSMALQSMEFEPLTAAA